MSDELVNEQAPETPPVSPAPTASKAEEHMIPKSRLDEEISKRKALESQIKELDTLRAEKAKREEAEMTEIQRNAKRAEEAEARAKRLELDILRRDVIAESGLPSAFADRLKGETKEELLADAEELSKNLPALKTPPHLSSTNPNNATAKETDAQMRERLFGRQSNPFDIETIKAQGGGVVWNKK